MPWQPLPRIAFAVATFPFVASSPADLPLELGDELYIIEQGGKDLQWFRGYLVAPPNLLAGLTSTKGQTLEARVFSGIFPASCVEVREVLGDDEGQSQVSTEDGDGVDEHGSTNGILADKSSSAINGAQVQQVRGSAEIDGANGQPTKRKRKSKVFTNGNVNDFSIIAKREPGAPKPAAPVPMLKIGDETPTSASEPLVDEIASCLREWHSTNLHELLLSRQYHKLDKMSTLVKTLDLSRRQILHNVCTKHELQSLREKTVWDLVRGNKLLNGEVIVRDPAARGRVLTGDDSAVDVTRLQSMMSLLDEKPQLSLPNENLALHHLQLDVKAFVGASTGSTTLSFFLATKKPGSIGVALSETYTVEVPASASLSSMGKSGQIRTLFTDLASADIGDLPSTEGELYLIVKVQSSSQVTAGKPTSRSGSRGNSFSRDSVSKDREKPAPSSAAAKAGRRSLMWGKTKNTPNAGKLNSLTENSEPSGESQSSRDGANRSSSSRNGSDSKPGTISQTISKTVGMGALRLSSLMKNQDEAEHVMTIWSPSTTPGNDKPSPSDGWEEVIRDLMTSQSGQYEKSRRTERLQVYLKAFDSPDADGLIKSTPTLLSGILKTNKMGFSGAPTKPRSDIYVTLDEAFLPKQALLSRSIGSAMPVPSSFVGSNLQVTMEVRKSSGERLEGAIYPSSNADGQSSWESVAAERGDAWNQTLRLCIPQQEVPNCHLVMVLADAPNHPLAICHIPLWDQQAFMRDGHHSLLLYKYDETTMLPRGSSTGKGGYLSLPWNSRGKDDVSKDEAVTGPIATLRIQTFLCSTKFSQDKVLLRLLKWKDQPPGDLQQLLQRLVFVSEIEIVKLLSDVFDAIFGILVENTGNDDYEDLIFSALVTVLSIVHDRRFNLGPLVDQYAETRFNYPFASPCLVRSFTRLLASPSDPETSRKLRATFKVVRHILKFITHARGQQKAKEADIGITHSSSGFGRQLRQIFKALEGMMRTTAPILVGSQTLAVQHFHTWLPELSGLLSREQILHIAIDFMDSCALVKGKLILYKLVLIINFSRMDLFSRPEHLKALATNTSKWILPHWGKTTEVTEQWREQVRLCCSILAIQMKNLGPEIPQYIPKIIDSYLALRTGEVKSQTRLSLLFPTSYPFPSKAIAEEAEFDEVLIELSAVLSAISNLPAGMQLELAEGDMATLIEDFLNTHLSILECEAFPQNWLSVRIFHHKSTLKTLEYLAGILLDKFLPHPDDAENYNTELWKAFFTTLLKLIGSDYLALETFPEQKRRAVWKIAGDVRENGAELLRRTWEFTGWDTTHEERQKYALAKMGGYQVQYVPALVGPILELCLSVHEGLRRVAVEVLQTMIVSEWTLSEDLSAIQTGIIECLDHLFKSKPLTESILQKLFINELFTLFDNLSRNPDDPLYNAVKELIGTTDEFLDLLVAVHSTDVTGEASHMIHRLRLMEFLRDMHKEDIFIRYVHQLAEFQTNAGNHTEAGLALRLHADLYQWDPSKLLPPLDDPDFPAQSHFDRKERIYFDMIKNFEEGEAWSSAIAAYKELQYQYEENVFDFSKLARTQRAIATIYESISKADKIVPKYFRVIYRGMGFPQSLRDKEFVYEGSPNEKTSVFTDRMQEQHPSAQIVTSGDIDDVEGQFLQISALSPHRDISHHVFQRSKVSQVVRDYLLSTHPRYFSTTSRRTTSGPIGDHSAEKIIYTTADTFPTILRRSEIISVDRYKLDAHQTALERIIRKTQEMAAVEKRIADGEDDIAPLLVEALNVSVNPTSESSVARYRELLPNPTDDEDEDGEGEVIELGPIENALKVALIDHAIMIKRCLAMFAKSPNLHSQDDLQHYFEQTFSPELASLQIPQPRLSNTSPGLVPGWALSPTSSKGDLLNSSQGHLTLPHSQSFTNGTIDTSILDSPNHTRATAASKRISSFLTRNATFPERESRPLRKDNRKSFFSGNGLSMNGISITNKDRGRKEENVDEFQIAEEHDLSHGNLEDSKEWVTQSDLSVHPPQGNYTTNSIGQGRRSSSSQRRPDTTGTGSSQGMAGLGMGMGIGMGSNGSGLGGSVRKRFSMLRLGKKGSTVGSGLSGDVVEE
ncbi:3558dd32-0b9c-4e2e-a3e9-d8d914c3c568 [Sclerotinia trifoliorum]|uniref:3558dd32-0b9c-4e2e-a3e9-d8d914c3c568 n=1 Tax=Sclerotinia trifoliorum TaxID=28548 RepID=A0A8H2VW35_9HELO|nr:3558dd32-0b9c-4e2e-a3e9-d8d914c3c568 [Sclerotinia trifoliorum]